MTKKDRLDKKEKSTFELLYVIGLYIWIFVSFVSIVFFSFWMYLKILFIGCIIFGFLGMFLSKEAINRIVYGTMPNNNTPNKKQEETSQNVDWHNNYKPVQYDEDDTYDNFYSQREEEYRQEYGDDYEDAIDDAWEEHQRNRKR